MGQKWDPFEVPQRLHVANPNMEWTEDLCFGDDTFHWPRWLHAHPNWTGALPGMPVLEGTYKDQIQLSALWNVLWCR